MTTEQTPSDEEPEATEVAKDKDPNVELRAAFKREKALSAKYRGELMESRLDAIGLTHTEGLGKAIAKEYDGDMTVEAMSAYAQEEYSYQGEVTQTSPEVATGERLERLSEVSESITPPEPSNPVQDADASMNDPESGRIEAKSSLATKAGAFYDEHYGT